MVLSTIINFKKSKITQSHNLLLSLKGKDCEVILSPIYNHKLKLKGVAIIIRDISTKIQMENLKKEFSANVTHELKTPLTTILGHTEMMKNNLVDSNDYPKIINRIYDESRRLLATIDSVLKLSFFDESKQDNLMKKSQKSLNLRVLANRVLERLSPKLKQNNISVYVDSSEKCEIIGVEELLENLIYNLCDNAICYNKQNGTIHIKIFKNVKNIIFSIKDSGIGIPKESQEKIFERFYCVDKAKSKKLGGTGLGLSIVKAVAQYHNASITLHSNINEGSEFIIAFKEPKSKFS